MIVRILGEGQYRLDDAELAMLNALDDAVEDAAGAGDREGLREALGRLLAEVRTQGVLLDDDLLITSDVIIPADDTPLERVQEWMGEDDSFAGLLP